MIFTTSKPERDDALTAIREAIIAAVDEWPAGEPLSALTRQLSAHLHTQVSNNEFDAIHDAYLDYTGRLDWNRDEILDYLDETRWHPALEDAAWEKALRTLTETTNTILLAMGHDILTDQDTADLFNGDNPTTLRSAA